MIVRFWIQIDYKIDTPLSWISIVTNQVKCTWIESIFQIMKIGKRKKWRKKGRLVVEGSWEWGWEGEINGNTILPYLTFWATHIDTFFLPFGTYAKFGPYSNDHFNDFIQCNIWKFFYIILVWCLMITLR